MFGERLYKGLHRARAVLFLCDLCVEAILNLNLLDFTANSRAFLSRQLVIHALASKDLQVAEVLEDSLRLGLIFADELELSVDHGGDTVVHILHEGRLGEAESPPIRDVVDVVIGFGMFTLRTADLHIELISDGLESGLVLAEVGQVDVHGGAQARATVRRTRSDVAQVAIVLEGDLGFESAGASNQTLEHLEKGSALLHGDDAQVVFLVDPDEESLVGVVVDAAGFGPVAV